MQFITYFCFNNVHYRFMIGEMKHLSSVQMSLNDFASQQITTSFLLITQRRCRVSKVEALELNTQI